ncbi:MAG: elongation factor Ts [Candidatus Gastranaerophilales bacterium]|nr:elongation factor Ts [Candidatus Gastranaerophilales bacterium]
MEIKASMVKELREKTGAGMMDAKKALVETNGDMEKAIELLRQKGMASADKKMGRIAAEGVVASAIDGSEGAMVEINCETDFVAKNDDFKALANMMARAIIKLNPSSVDELLTMDCPECKKPIETVIKEKIATIGEKITIRRFVKYAADGAVNTYIHNGKIGVLLEATGAADETLTKDICLHIASNAPEFVSRDQIPASVIEEEKRIEMGKEDLANKPEQIREKIVEGRVNKLMAQRCLLEQPFVKNPDQTIAQLIEGKTQIVKFERFVLGEGLEKRQDDFAAEVMSQIKG